MVKCGLWAAVVFSWMASGAGAADDFEAGAKPLGQFSGQWKGEYVRKTKDKPEGQTINVEETTTPALKGRFVIGRELNPATHHRAMWLLTYDPQAKNYQQWFFNTGGLMGTHWKGSWEDATHTLQSQFADPPAGFSSHAETRFTGDRSAELTAWMKDAKGDLVFDVRGKRIRQADEPAAKLLDRWKAAPDDVKLSAELAVLDRLAGTWDVSAVSKQAEWTPEEKRIKSKVVRTWVLNRMFLLDESQHDDGTEGMSLFTYDPKQKAYRSWWFSSQGYTSMATGQWDADASTLYTRSTLPTGQSSKGSCHITDPDHHEWKIQITDAAGKVYFDCVWNCIRAKP